MGWFRAPTADLVVRWFEVSGGALLPGYGGVTRLFDQTSQAHFSGPQEFGVTGLHERG